MWGVKMVKFKRKLQRQNRIVIPPEIMEELGWKFNTLLEIEVKEKKVIITKKVENDCDDKM